jgi:hypothetical protein
MRRQAVGDLYERLLAKVEDEATGINYWVNGNPFEDVTRAVVELHKPEDICSTVVCGVCPDLGDDFTNKWPCSTIRAVARALDVEVPE